MQLIVPMTGVGQRFVDAGYDKLKPLIRILEKPMIEWVMSMYPPLDTLFIISETNPQKDELVRFLESRWPHAKIAEIAAHKKGPSYAVWKAKEFIRPNVPVIINYCDFGGTWDFAEFSEKIQQNDGVILTYSDFHPHMLRNTKYAYVQTDGDGNVTQIQEKESFTNNPMAEEASAGAYGFKNSTIMLSSIEAQLHEDISLNGEFYTSLTYRPMLANGNKIKTVRMRKFFQWGTPEDLADWLSWIRRVQIADSSLPEFENTDSAGASLILAAGLGHRLAAHEKTPKPFIKVAGKELWRFSLEAASGGGVEPKVITRQEIASQFQLPPKQLYVLGKLTRGQAETARLGIELISQDSPLSAPVTIFSCDNVIEASSRANAEELLDRFDLVVWTSPKYDPAARNPEHFSWVSVSDGRILSASFKGLTQDLISPQMIIGNFTFKSIELARDLIDSIFADEITINNEYYLDSLVTIALNRGLRVGACSIENFFAVGTVEEFETYRYFESINQLLSNSKGRG